MTILAIETSCDETGVAIVKNGNTLLANELASQTNWHKAFGGVVPELASRMHTEKINLLIQNALDTAQLNLNQIDALAVTCGPGLEGALLVGITAAKTLSVWLDRPLIPVHHLHGHIYAGFLEKAPVTFPLMALIVSGGHTMLVLVKDHFQFELIGTTRDDAAGEAFDKVARYCDLPYPGGPVIEKKAKEGNPKAFSFPRAMLHEGFEFSFSGLKTAVIMEIKKLRETHTPLPIADICASFQQAVIDILIHKAMVACDHYHSDTLLLCGGVSANTACREAFELACKTKNRQLIVPSIGYCTDNAAMIAACAYYQQQHLPPIPLNKILVKPSWPICN